MITYYYPPQGGAGVQRALKFIRYLPEFGWSPVVLASKPEPGAILDPTLIQQIPGDTVNVRVKGFSLPRWFPWRVRSWITRWILVVDEQLGWYIPGLRAASSLIRQHNPQAIFSTSSPFTSHLIALELKKSTSLPWVADFRDPWVDNPNAAYPTRWHARRITSLERKVCMSADRILVTTPRARLSLLQRLDDLPQDKVIYLPNGYDPQDFSSLQPADSRISDNPSDIFKIVHSGSFYSHGRTPDFFLQALNNLLSSSVIPRNKIRLHLAGNLGKPALLAVERSGVKDLVVEHGYLSHSESLKLLMNADLLLLINHPGKAGELVVPAKLYEYLGAGKPFLLLTGQGAVSDLSRQIGFGTVVDPEDIGAISRALLEYYQLWESRTCAGKVREADLTPFQRRPQARQLAKLLDSLV